jgi:hypothetical protein
MTAAGSVAMTIYRMALETVGTITARFICIVSPMAPGRMAEVVKLARTRRAAEDRGWIGRPCGSVC